MPHLVKSLLTQLLYYVILYHFCVSKKLDAYFISLDFQKAFDLVTHEWLQNVMRTIGLPDHFLTIVEQLTANACSQVQVNGFLMNA